MSGTCLCELINTGICDGAEKQVICPSHPGNRSTRRETWLDRLLWPVQKALTDFGDLVNRKSYEWHWRHTWSLWRNVGSPFAVAYPWTKAGCFAHYVQKRVRDCAVCHEEERYDHIY
jgi:hypothetical protein